MSHTHANLKKIGEIGFHSTSIIISSFLSCCLMTAAPSGYGMLCVSYDLHVTLKAKTRPTWYWVLSEIAWEVSWTR